MVSRGEKNLLWNEWHCPLTVTPSWYFQVVSETLAVAKMKAGLLKARKDVWTCSLSSVSQWGMYVRRQVMYYLQSNPTLCLIRAWLRGSLTTFFPPRVKMWTSAHKWRWTYDLHADLSLHLHRAIAKCRTCITLLSCHVHGQAMSLEYFKNIALIYIIYQTAVG